MATEAGHWLAIFQQRANLMPKMGKGLQEEQQEGKMDEWKEKCEGQGHRNKVGRAHNHLPFMGMGAAGWGRSRNPYVGWE